MRWRCCATNAIAIRPKSTEISPYERRWAVEHTPTLEDVIHLIGQLKPEDRTTLLQQIQRSGAEQISGPVTRESILAEFVRRLLTGELDNLPSALGLLLRPDLDLTFEEIEADIHEFS